MEFKGTKGKWIQSHRKRPDSKKGYYSTQVYTEDGETIATIHWYPKPIENNLIGTYRESNALLISKAPEFLKELVNEVEILKAMGLGDTERCKRKERLIKEATEL